MFGFLTKKFATMSVSTRDDNQAYEEDEVEHPFKNNFIDTPWDDRSRNSKIGIISLLVAISAVIVICVCNSFIMHYQTSQFSPFTVENTCPIMTKDENYKFVAKIYSISTKKLLCVGAVLSTTLVLADEICVRDGPVLLVVGSMTDPRCRKGYTVDANEIIEIPHKGMLSKKLIILESKSSFAECGVAIPVGSRLALNSSAYIIGRPLSNHRRGALTMQPVTVFGRRNCSIPRALRSKLKSSALICVKDFGRCRVRAGDLLVQNGQLYGLAAAGDHMHPSSTEAYFADLIRVYDKILSMIAN